MGRRSAYTLSSMRVQLALLLLVALVFLGWAAFGSRTESANLLTARDRLVAEESLTVHFDPGGVEGYRLITIPGGGWLWERTSAAGVPYADAIVFNGQGYLLRVAENCFISRAGVRPPLVPGVTTSQRLVRQPSLDRRPGDLVAYTIAPDFAAAADTPPNLPDVEIIEDLSRLRSESVMRATTGAIPDYIWRGNYTVARSTASETQYARDVVRRARASDYAEMIVRERVVGTVVGSVIQEPSAVVVAKECPDSPARVWSGAGGGQAEGLRVTPATFALITGDTPAFRNAARTAASNLSQIEYLNDAFERATFGDVPVRTLDNVLISTGNGTGVALRVLSCTARPWFRC